MPRLYSCHILILPLIYHSYLPKLLHIARLKKKYLGYVTMWILPGIHRDFSLQSLKQKSKQQKLLREVQVMKSEQGRGWKNSSEDLGCRMLDAGHRMQDAECLPFRKVTWQDGTQEKDAEVCGLLLSFSYHTMNFNLQPPTVLTRAIELHSLQTFLYKAQQMTTGKKVNHTYSVSRLPHTTGRTFSLHQRTSLFFHLCLLLSSSILTHGHDGNIFVMHHLPVFGGKMLWN